MGSQGTDGNYASSHEPSYETSRGIQDNLNTEVLKSTQCEVSIIDWKRQCRSTSQNILIKEWSDNIINV